MSVLVLEGSLTKFEISRQNATMTRTAYVALMVRWLVFVGAICRPCKETSKDTVKVSKLIRNMSSGAR